MMLQKNIIMTTIPLKTKFYNLNLRVIRIPLRVNSMLIRYNTTTCSYKFYVQWAGKKSNFLDPIHFFFDLIHLKSILLKIQFI